MKSISLFFLIFTLIFISFKINALENGLARTPPMGWMSWTRFYCELNCQRFPHACINERLYQEHGDRLVQDGYLAVGYNTIHVDDCWAEKQRDQFGRMVPDKRRFPSGMTGLADYLHARGLKFGLYGDYGTKTCAGYPGTMNFEQIDAETFASWRIDYLKMDGCNSDYYQMERGYPLFGRFLNSTTRPIIYSCSWPAYWADRPHLVKYNLISQHCNLWRNEADIVSTWPSILGIINIYVRKQNEMVGWSGPGRFHDPDMLVIGNPGISEGMSRVQMSVWSIWSAPLIMSNDLRQIQPEFRKILQNTRVIAVDQDPLGRFGRMVLKTPQLMYFVKAMTPINDGKYSFAVAVVNYSNRPVMASISLSALGITDPSGYFLQDLWTGQQLGFRRSSDLYQQLVPAIDAQLFKATSISQTNQQPARTQKPPLEFTTRRSIVARSTRNPRFLMFRRG